MVVAGMVVNGCLRRLMVVCGGSWCDGRLWEWSLVVFF
jgi:hypothetical protein